MTNFETISQRAALGEVRVQRARRARPARAAALTAGTHRELKLINKIKYLYMPRQRRAGPWEKHNPRLHRPLLREFGAGVRRHLAPAGGLRGDTLAKRFRRTADDDGAVVFQLRKDVR